MLFLIDMPLILEHLNLQFYVKLFFFFLSSDQYFCGLYAFNVIGHSPTWMLHLG